MTFSAAQRALTLVLVIAALAAPALFAQAERASIVGTVTDATGSVAPGVEVAITNEGTSATVRLTTDESGSYTAVNLVPGSYTVAAQLAGFSRQVFTGYVIQVNQIARLDITLQVGAIDQTVEVQATAPLLHTEDSAMGQVISPKPISDLPLNGRNFAQLAIIAPGMTGLDFAQTNTINSGKRPDELRPGGTTILAIGSRNMMNQMLIDGIDATEMISQTFVVRPTVEGIQEFKVTTNNAGAQFGRAAGAVVVLTTKSGSNEFHGSLFEFLRNAKLDAKNYFDRKDAPIPQFQLNQFGGSIGGPIRRNRLFFFSDYEGYRERLGNTLVETVPTAKMRAGDFSGATTNGIFDPLTTRPAAGGGSMRDRYQNDLIPISAMDPIARQMVQLYPNPQNSSLSRNFVANPVKESTVDRGNIRVDFQLSDSDQLFGRYSQDNARLQIPDTFNTDIGGNPNSFAGPQSVRGDSLVVADSHTFTPTFIGDFRFGYTRFDSKLTPTELTNPLWATIPGRDLSDPYQPSAPIIEPAGYSGLGNARSSPLIRFQNMTEYIANFTWVRGSHNLKYGIDFRRRLTSETASPPGQSAFGRFNFNNAFTVNPLSRAGTGHTMASMLLGYPSNTVRDFFIPGTATLTTQEYNYFFSDEWRVNNRLTLNLGVHYEVNTPFVEENDYWVNFDPAASKLLLAGINADRAANITTDFRSLGPRFALAYQFTPKTVLRTGYGIFYAPQSNAGTNIRQFRQQPYDLIFSIVPGDLVVDNRVSQGFKKLEDFPPVDPNNPFGTIRGVTNDFRNAAVQQFNFGIQHEVANNSVLTVAFVGSLGRFLTWNQPINVPLPGAGNIQQRRPYNSALPLITDITWLQSSGSSAFTSLQTSFERRFGGGLFFLGNWTWSHALDNAGEDGGAGGPLPQNPLDRDNDWSSQNSDIRHRVNLSWTYSLPFGPGKKWLNDGSALGAIVGDWEFANITVLQSGHPFTVTATGNPTNTGRGGRADLVSSVSPDLDNPTPDLWFNPAAFAFPTAFNWGNVGRNTLTGPPAANFDFTVSRTFRIGESKSLLFRSEFFNAFNHPQFELPAAVLGNAGLGQITSTARPARQIQFALKFVF